MKQANATEYKIKCDCVTIKKDEKKRAHFQQSAERKKEIGKSNDKTDILLNGHKTVLLKVKKNAEKEGKKYSVDDAEKAKNAKLIKVAENICHRFGENYFIVDIQSERANSFEVCANSRQHERQFLPKKKVNENCSSAAVKRKHCQTLLQLCPNEKKNEKKKILKKRNFRHLIASSSLAVFFCRDAHSKFILFLQLNATSEANDL